MSQIPKNISVVVTCLNEEVNIGACLDSLIKQNYPAAHLEIIVVDGGSRDRTQEIIKEFAVTEPPVKLVIDPRKGTAAGRNAGIQAAAFEMIAFTDADCEVPADWLTTLANHFLKGAAKNENLAGVGGTNIPPADANRLTRAVGVALDSYLGSFSSPQGRQFETPQQVASLATLNVMYRKEVLLKIGKYDETLGSEAEDAELNYRLTRAGYRLLFVPDSFVWHKMRPTATGWFKNMFRYGKGRARLLKRYPEMWAISYVLPILFLAALSLSLLAPFANIFLLTLLYFPGIFIFSVFQCVKKKSPGLLCTVLQVYLLQHFGYAVGEVYGLLNTKVR